MARARARARAHSKRRMASGSTTTNRQAVNGRLNASVVPRVLLGAVDGIGAVAMGALQVARDVSASTVSGVANIGAAALTATAAGTRGVVSAAARTVAEFVATAQDTLLATTSDLKHSRRGPARLEPRRAAAAVTPQPSPHTSRARRGKRRPRVASRPARASVAV